MFFVLALVLVAAVFAAASSRGPQTGLWVAWWLALLVFPSWLALQIGSLQIDYRTVAAAAGLGGFALRKDHARLGRWLVGDTLAVLLCTSLFLSQARSAGFGPLLAPQLINGWLLPYMVGRLFLRGPKDLSGALRCFCAVMAPVAALAVLEAVVKVNPTAALLGKTFGMLEMGEGYRMGLKRSHGPLSHPICFGLLLVMMLPWASEAARLARGPWGRRWWQVVPGLAVAAVLATNSRGAWVAAIVTAYALAFFRLPPWRKVLGPAFLALAVGVPTSMESVLSLMSAAAGGEQTSVVVIGGQERVYSSARHRLLLFEVYSQEMTTAGAFGHGHALQGIELEEGEEKFWSIDCHYLLFLLRNGYVGVTLFVGLTAVTLFYAARAAWRPSEPLAGLAAGLFGAVLGVAISLWSVSMPPDFGAAMLFGMGLAGNLEILRARGPLVARPPARPLRRPAF